MRKLFAAVQVAILLSGPAIGGGYYDGNDLLAMCQKDDQTACLAYIAGASDMVGARNFTDLRPPVTCEPENANLGQLKEILVLWLEQNPSRRNVAATVNYMAAMYEAFPCE